ncbi:MAG: CDP-alcohol phosphatidyltransferase family protein [Ignavibacteriae bacterium]|nr:MAG: CDP-alcohol phosphatidyltransferase family protein [Ignavibacteriota bacterium]
MTLIQQYKESLKVVEAEEYLDLLFYRPVAFLFVKATFALPLTPNMVSTIAMCFGIAAGFAFGRGWHEYLVLGAILYLSSNVLDCADGQIARLKKNGTKVGRIVDGFLDYVVSTAVFVGIGVGLTNLYNNGTFHSSWNYLNLNPVVYIWVLTVLAGLSSAVQAFLFDFYRNLFLEKSFGKFSSLEDEINEFEEEQERIKREPETSRVLDNFLIWIYLKYTRLQLKIQFKKKYDKYDWQPSPEAYYLKNKTLLRAWSFIGSTTHITLCVICALANSVELFLVLCVLPLNILLAVLYFVQISSNKKLLEQSKINQLQ